MVEGSFVSSEVVLMVPPEVLIRFVKVLENTVIDVLKTLRTN